MLYLKQMEVDEATRLISMTSLIVQDDFTERAGTIWS